MNEYLRLLLFVFCGLNIGCKGFHNENTQTKALDSQRINENKGYSINSLIRTEISSANTKFKISDTEAIQIVRHVNDLKELIDCKYVSDSTIYNVAIITDTPSDTFPNWTINIRQLQPHLSHSTSLMYLIVNANSGVLKIWDIPGDTILTLDEWRRLRKK
jgi:hypothetical protein